ncbi:beta-ketoacyl-[acyl-carrier-protein] synthase family protein [Streptomyces cyaneofuscatus]|uniref:beta-ketoacyl-[acyl-carrier-protein] synthase family protein n=1 Tax=Streptomyces cyaneofuscatus TaxID=66883 RepID=UPI003664A817
MAEDSVAVTGIGAQLATGSGVTAFWEGLREGRPGVRDLYGPEFSSVPNAMAATVERRRPIDLLPGLEPRYAASYSDEILLAMAAAEQARCDAGLPRGGVDPSRLSLIASSSRGPLAWWDSEAAALSGDGDDPPRAAALLGLPGAPASLYAVYADVRGHVSTLSSACVGGHQAIGWAADMLRARLADAVIVLGHEFPAVPSLFRCYNALGVLSHRTDDSSGALRAYGADRDGFVLGEGAVALVLERAADAERRGARPYAHVLGYRSENEAAHATRMDGSGRSMATLIGRLLEEERSKITDVSYVCGHGSATRLNDRSESRALKQLYEGVNRERWAPLGGNKAVVGHTLGASGVVNAAAGSLMLHHQELARTAAFGPMDPECDLDHVIDGPRRTPLKTVLSLSYALGSQSSALLLKAAS